MGKLSVFTLGHKGVIIDANPLEPGVPDDALMFAQNATHDPKAGHGGAVRKRNGFAKFSANTGAIILGGIMMPVAETGGAPAAGGGAIIGTGDSADGTSPGTGDMTGNPGGTFDGGAVETTPAGAGAFTASSVFGGVRLVVIGLDDSSAASDGGRAWYLTSKNFADTATKSTVSTGPCQAYSYPTYVAPYVNGLQGQPSCIGQDGRLYYAASHGNQSTGGTTSGILPIYVTDGGVALLLANIQANATNAASYYATGTTIRGAIMNIHAGSDGFLYVAVKWKYAGQDTAGSAGSVFRVRPTTGEVVEWNTGTAAATPAVLTSIPYSLSYYAGYLFIGMANNIDAGNAGIIASNGTEGLVDMNLSGGSANNFTSMCQFNGRLFAGTGITKAAATPLALLMSRGPSGGITGGGAWSSFSFDLARTGASTNGNSYVSMVVYNDTTMFVSWHAPSSQSIIYKVVADAPGDPESSAAYTFTTAYASGAGSTAPLNLYLDQNTLYAISSGDSTVAVALISTDGGANWTDRSSKFGALATSSFPIPVFFALDQ